MGTPSIYAAEPVPVLGKVTLGGRDAVGQLESEG